MAWPTSKSAQLEAQRIKKIISQGSYVKVFHKIQKHLKGWIPHKEELKFKLDLLDEYSLPICMPKDMHEYIDFDTDQAYIIMATEGTGKF